MMFYLATNSLKSKKAKEGKVFGAKRSTSDRRPDLIMLGPHHQGWTGKLFFSRGGAGRGTPPSPQFRAGGEGVKICGAGRGRGREHTACTD